MSSCTSLCRNKSRVQSSGVATFSAGRMVAARWSKLACFVRIHCHHGPTFGFPQQQLGWPRRIARCGRAWAWDRAGHPEPGAISPKDLLMMMVSSALSERRTYTSASLLLRVCAAPKTNHCATAHQEYFELVLRAHFFKRNESNL